MSDYSLPQYKHFGSSTKCRPTCIIQINLHTTYTFLEILEPNKADLLVSPKLTCLLLIYVLRNPRVRQISQKECEQDSFPVRAFDTVW